MAVLFSGGLDSMVIAALAHKVMPLDEPIDLINVCFDKHHLSPDRLAAWAGLEELQVTTYLPIRKKHIPHSFQPPSRYSSTRCVAYVWTAWPDVTVGYR